MKTNSTAWSPTRSKGGPSLIAARIDDKPGVATTDRDPVRIRASFMAGLGVKR